MKIDRHSARMVFAGWNPDPEESRTCASGGTAYLLEKHFIADLGGIVYATAHTPEKTAAVIRTTTLQDLEKTKGSRYVRGSFSKELHDLLKEDLKGGRPILFIGTPCQVAGLRGILKSTDTGNNNIIFVDLLCHGAPPQAYLDAEIKYLIGDHPYTDVRFRGNDDHDFHLSIWDKENCLYSVKARKQPYLLAMLRGVTLMEGCYKCPFASPERTGDITIGDYIGLGAADGFKVERHNVSYISINTPRGETAFRGFLRSQATFRAVERPAEERLAYKPSILEATPRSPLRDTFLKHMTHSDFPRAIRRTMRGEILRETPLYRTLHHWAHLLLRRP